MYRTVAAAMLVVVAICAGYQERGTAVSTVAPDIVKDFAPTGKLRTAINLGNSVLAQKDAASGALRGVSVELAQELARRLAVAVEFTTFDAAGKVFEALKAGALDVVFLAIEPVRAAEIAFTAPYVIIEGTYLVPAHSPLQSIADVDREGVRIAVATGSAYDLYLTRTLKHAQLLRASSGPGALDLFIRERFDAAGGVKQSLQEFARANPNVRLMDGRFMAIQQAMGMPKGRDAAAGYLHAFVEEMKASGFVARALRETNQLDAVVAPPAGN